MRTTQQLLFPDPRPLVERFGPDFFRTLPVSAGVYLMRGANEVVLYVGKAKNLRKRLGSYRVANPERLARRTLRLLHVVQRIEWQCCSDEAAALAREAELLRSLRPKFNRAGVWPGGPRAIPSREGELGLQVADEPIPPWQYRSVTGRETLRMRLALVNLLRARALAAEDAIQAADHQSAGLGSEQ